MRNGARALLAVFLYTLPLSAAAPNPPGQSPLPNVRWQVLPDEVYTGVAGPDGRVWYRCESLLRREADRVSLVKQHIEREFRQPSPRLFDVRVALFEPGGRVWFAYQRDNESVLLGYDGTTWIEHPIADGADMVCGRCPTRGALHDGRANRYAGGVAWFITPRGVLRFDGRQWHHQTFIEQAATLNSLGHVHPGGVWLAVSPDGQSALAYAEKTTACWELQAGQWKQRELAPQEAAFGAALKERRGRIRALALPDNKAAWCLVDFGPLRCLPLSGAAVEPKITALIDALKDDSFAAREKASRQLLEMPSTILPLLESALENSTDTEQRVRLEAILKRMRAAPRRPRPETLVGTDRVGECRQVYEDGQGRLFVIAAQLNGKPDGVLIVERDGTTATLFGQPLAAAWTLGWGEDNPPIILPPGDQVWLANRAVADGPKLLNLKTGRFVDALPYPEFSRIHAVSGDRRVFVSVYLPQGPRPVAVYTPGVPSTEPAPVVRRMDAVAYRYAITDEGSVWVCSPNGLARFHGDQWQMVRGPKDSDQHLVLHGGQGDVMLTVPTLPSPTPVPPSTTTPEPVAALYEGARQIAAGPLYELLQQHRERVRKAFGPGGSRGRTPCAGVSHGGVIADRAGNVWCLEPLGRLRVECGGQWLDASAALRGTASATGNVVNIALIDDGARLYVGDLDMKRGFGGRAFFAAVKDGKPHFVAASDEYRFDRTPRNLIDCDDALWVTGSFRGSHGAFRIGRTGGIEEYRRVGLPMLADEAGNMWLCDISGPFQEMFSVWRGGKTVQQVQIPRANADTFLVSNRPGSVYAWTIAGLQHLVADGPAFDKYRLAKLYPLEGLLGQSISRSYCKPGYLVTLNAIDARAAPHYRIHLVKLPE